MNERMVKFKEYLSRVAFKECVAREYKNVEIDSIKMNFNSYHLENVHFNDVQKKWYGDFSDNKLPREILIGPSKKKIKEIKNKKLENLYAYATFNVVTDKRIAQDKYTGADITISECINTRDSGRTLSLCCPLCKSDFSFVYPKNPNKNGNIKSPHFKSKNKNWCCQNSLSISVFRIHEENEEVSDNKTVTRNITEKTITVKIEEEYFDFFDGNLTDKKTGEITDLILNYREFYIRNWDLVIGTLNFKKYNLMTFFKTEKEDGTATKKEYYTATRIKDTNDMMKIIKEHLEITVKQINENKKNYDAVVKMNIEMIEVIQKKPALFELLKGSKDYEKNLKRIEEYKKDKGLN